MASNTLNILKNDKYFEFIKLFEVLKSMGVEEVPMQDEPDVPARIVRRKKDPKGDPTLEVEFNTILGHEPRSNTRWCLDTPTRNAITAIVNAVIEISYESPDEGSLCPMDKPLSTGSGLCLLDESIPMHGGPSPLDKSLSAVSGLCPLDESIPAEGDLRPLNVSTPADSGYCSLDEPSPAKSSPCPWDMPSPARTSLGARGIPSPDREMEEDHNMEPLNLTTKRAKHAPSKVVRRLDFETSEWNVVADTPIICQQPSAEGEVEGALSNTEEQQLRSATAKAFLSAIPFCCENGQDFWNEENWAANPKFKPSHEQEETFNQWWETKVITSPKIDKILAEVQTLRENIYKMRSAQTKAANYQPASYKDRHYFAKPKKPTYYASFPYKNRHFNAAKYARLERTRPYPNGYGPINCVDQAYFPLSPGPHRYNYGYAWPRAVISRSSYYHHGNWKNSRYTY
jgi:hypothetical protein